MLELASPPKGLGSKEEAWLTPNLLLYSGDRASFQGWFAVGPAMSGHRPSTPGCPERRQEATVLQRASPSQAITCPSALSHLGLVTCLVLVKSRCGLITDTPC